MGLPQFAEFAENILKKVRNEKSPKEGVANDAIFEFVPIDLDDLRKQGAWKNAAGDRLRVDVDALKTMSYTGGGQEVFYDSAQDILHILTEGKYVLVPATPKTERVTGEHNESQMVDQEQVDQEQVDQERAQEVLAQLRKVPTEESDLRPKAPVIATIVSAKGGQFPAKRASKSQKERDPVSGSNATQSGEGAGSGEDLVIDRIAEESQSMQQLIESVQAQSGQDASGAVKDLLEDILGDKVILDEDIARVKQKGGRNRKELADLDERCKTLFGRAIEAQQDLALLLSQPAPAASRGEDGPQTTPAPTSTGEAPRTPEDGERVAILLKTRQDKAVVDIGTIATPQDFADFRGKLREVEGKDSEGKTETKWYFINQESLEKELSTKENLLETRRLREAEIKQLHGTEDFLRIILRQKFEVVNDADIQDFADQEQKKIMATQSEAELDALVASWPVDLNQTATWKDKVHILTKSEIKSVKKGYDEAVFTLKQNAEIQRRALELGPSYAALNDFRNRNEKARNTTQLFKDAIEREYAGYEAYMKREVKKKGETISSERCWTLWQEQKGDDMAEAIIVESLQRFHDVHSEEGKKIFQALLEELKQKN